MMQISRSTVARAVRELRNNPLVSIHISRASCTGLSDPIPEGGPFKAHQVWRSLDGNFLLKLKMDKNGNLLPNDRASFSKEEIDKWLEADDGPWVWDLE